MPLDWLLIFFIIFSALTIFCALMVLFAKEIVRNVVWLVLTFIGVAITYIFLQAEYIAIIQILVYVGACPDPVRDHAYQTQAQRRWPV
jgi:NADH:ubiquinone oxidoreductase subunit 6 (subunit J)